MMRRATVSMAALAMSAMLATEARGWEAATTHAGLTEQSATESSLHERLLTQFGIDLGLFGGLTIPPKDAPELFEVLRDLNPTHGYVPDTRGRQSALAWLVAGSVIADVPVAAARNHFFDPSKGRGLVIDGDLPGPFAGRRLALKYVGTSDATPAPEWIRAAENPLNLDGFYGQYRRAVLARTPGERERHLAATLLAAGAVLHVLQDMGSPSHVRNDFGAHLAKLSDDKTDVGSRFERIAALAYGRLGVAAPSREVAFTRIDDFFTSIDGTGLAQWTAGGFFSSGTLPGTIAVEPRARAVQLAERIAGALDLPNPAPLAAGLDLIGAGKPGGATLVDDSGVCLARYEIRSYELQWSTDDDCQLEQIAIILPEVSAYSRGLLDQLFRGALAISRSDAGGAVVSVGDTELGAGTVTIVWGDSRGVRAQIGEPIEATGGTVGATLATVDTLPPDARSVAALFEGVDTNGERVVAAGMLDLTE
jgi:hypothetical protein